MTAPLPSKEQLIADIAHAEEKAATLCGPCADDHARLAYWLRALLAAYEQEPVAYMYRDNLHTDARFSLEPRFGNWSTEDIREYEISETPLYANPAPSIHAVPDEYRNSLQELVKAMRDYEMDVGEPAPYKHRAMMKRAEALLNGENHEL